MSAHDVSKSYQAASPEESEAAYDDWASAYEPDLCKAGYRIPAVIATVFTRFVKPDAAPILDAGCGGGIQSEPLALLGYRPIVGIDFSEGMMQVARAKGFYSELHRMVLGDRLDFDDDQFAAVISSGCITPAHAPAHSFIELIRVCRPGGLIVFSLRDDSGQLPEYPAQVQKLQDSDAWSPVFSTESFQSMPYGEDQISHRVHVYRVN